MTNDHPPRRTPTFTKILAVIGGITLVLLIVAVVLAIFFMRPDPVPSKVILELDLEQPVVEYIPPDPVARALQGEPLTVFNIVDALKRAEEDDRVVGLLVRVGNETLGYGMVQEIRDAVMSFRESGKPAVLFAETFGEFSAGRSPYYLATAFDSVYMQPVGDLGLVGLSSEAFFVSGTMDKLNVDVEYDHRYEYKSAQNILTEEEYTEPHREADGRVLASIYEDVLDGIAEARGMSVADVETLVENGPHFGEEAIETGLVDELLYRDEVFERMREQVGEDAEFLFLDIYHERAGTTFDRGDNVALIYGAGMILRGESAFDPLQGAIMGAETVTAAFRAAIEDEVSAIIFRIDNPGGSAVASEAVMREVVRAREAGIPVIATMGNVAGSGGYYVAMAADTIVAQPATITGSIGVVGGKFVTRDMWNEIGITWDEIYTAESGTMWSGLHPYDEHTGERHQAWLDNLYDIFTMRVAESRGMTQDEVHEIARGRIWSGKDALELGLVDALGGFHTALALARESAGLEEDADITLRPYPAERTLWEQITAPGRESSERAATVRMIQRTLDRARPALDALNQATMKDGDRVLLAPGLERYPVR